MLQVTGNVEITFLWMCGNVPLGTPGSGMRAAILATISVARITQLGRQVRRRQ